MAFRPRDTKVGTNFDTDENKPNVRVKTAVPQKGSPSSRRPLTELANQADQEQCKGATLKQINPSKQSKNEPTVIVKVCITTTQFLAPFGTI